MDVMTRDALRTAVIDKLLTDFPKAQKVAGGVAFMSETLDEETGLYFPVEIKVSVKNTQATARSEAYDFEKAVADFAAKPGRRVADPAKKAEQEAAKAAAAERKAANVAILKAWAPANIPAEGMLSSQILSACEDLAHLNAMQIGTICAACADEGVLTYSLDEKRRKIWTVVNN